MSTKRRLSRSLFSSITLRSLSLPRPYRERITGGYAGLQALQVFRPNCSLRSQPQIPAKRLCDSFPSPALPLPQRDFTARFPLRPPAPPARAWRSMPRSATAAPVDGLPQSPCVQLLARRRFSSRAANRLRGADRRGASRLEHHSATAAAVQQYLYRGG